MTTYVYVFGRLNERGLLTAPVKVGITNDVPKRLAALQTGHWDTLEIACAFSLPNREIAAAVESAFHTVMKTHRLKGEWFDISPQDALEAMVANLNSFFNHFLEGEMIDAARHISGVVAVESFLDRLSEAVQ